MERLLKQSMSILHNVAMREDNVERLRDLNTTQVLMHYLESSKDYYKCVVCVWSAVLFLISIRHW